MHRTVIIEADEKIGLLRFPNFGKQNSRQIRRTVNLLKRLFQRGTKRVGRHATERYVRGRASKSFGASQLNRHHPQSFNIARMSDAAHRDPVVNLKDLSPVTSEGQEQDPIGKTQSQSSDSRWQARSRYIHGDSKSLRPNDTVRQSCYVSLEQLGKLVV